MQNAETLIYHVGLRVPRMARGARAGERMSPSLFVEQSLNGVQLGVMLFLMSAGLTLVFGIMNLINLAHGSLYMAGAFFAAFFIKLTGSFIAAILLAIPATAIMGILMEYIVLRRFYSRSHLDQVLVTF